MPPSHFRAGAVACGLLAFVSGCAQEPGIGPSPPEPCILLCAVARSLAGAPEPVAAPVPITPHPKPVQEVKRQATHERRRVAALPAAPDPTPDPTPDPVLRKEVVSSPEPTSVPPPLPPGNPAVAVSAYALIPGSVPIEETTEHFVPRGPAAL